MITEALFPSDPNAELFFSFFSHLWDFIILNPKTKQWTSEDRYKLSPRVLWDIFNNSKKVLGVRFGQFTRYALIDIDRASLYYLYTHPEEFKKLIQAFEDIGLCRMVLIQSSYSEGVHIYFPLEKEVNTFSLACALRMAVETAGFKVKSGQLELFPNVKTYKKNEKKDDFSLYNGHRLPLQPNTGSAILNDDFHLESSSLSVFLTQMENAAKGQDMEKLEKILPLAREWHSKRYLYYSRGRNMNGNRLQEWKNDTETIIKEGFSDYGQTNDLIREIGKYGRVFLALAEAELAKYMVETITNLPGYKKYCRHQHEIEKRCDQWATPIGRYWWAIGTEPTRTIDYKTINQVGSQKTKDSNFNQKRSEECQLRLKETIQNLIKKGIELPRVVKERFKLLCDTSKELFGMVFSRNTLMKPGYRELWHPKYLGRSKEESNPDSEESDTKETSTESTTSKKTSTESEPTIRKETSTEPESNTSKETNAESFVSTNELVEEQELDNTPINPQRESNQVTNDDTKDTHLTSQPLKESNGNGSGKTIAPPDEQPKNDQILDGSEPSQDKQYSQNDRTFPFMKGSSFGAGLSSVGQAPLGLDPHNQQMNNQSQSYPARQKNLDATETQQNNDKKNSEISPSDRSSEHSHSGATTSLGNTNNSSTSPPLLGITDSSEASQVKSNKPSLSEFKEIFPKMNKLREKAQKMALEFLQKKYPNVRLFEAYPNRESTAYKQVYTAQLFNSSGIPYLITQAEKIFNAVDPKYVLELTNDNEPLEDSSVINMNESKVQVEWLDDAGDVLEEFVFYLYEKLSVSGETRQDTVERIEKMLENSYRIQPFWNSFKRLNMKY